MIRIEHAFGQLVREHGIEKFARPRLALHDQINRQRLQFGREFRVFAEKNVRKFRIFNASQGEEDTPNELRRAGREYFRQHAKQARITKGNERIQRLQPRGFRLVGGSESRANRGGIDLGKPEPGRKQFRTQ